MLPEGLVTQMSPLLALNLLSTFSVPDLKQSLKTWLRSFHRANFLPFFTLRALMTQQMQQVVCYKEVDLTPFLFSPFDSGHSDWLRGSLTTYCVFHILSFCTNRLQHHSVSSGKQMSPHQVQSACAKNFDCLLVFGVGDINGGGSKPETDL